MHATWRGMYERVHTEKRAHMNVPVHQGRWRLCVHCSTELSHSRTVPGRSSPVTSDYCDIMKAVSPS